MSALFSVATFCCVWLFSRPQKVEIDAIHQSFDKLSTAVNKLSEELQASRVDRAAMNEKLKTLFNNQEDIKSELEDLRSKMLECRRGDNQCSKK